MQIATVQCVCLKKFYDKFEKHISIFFELTLVKTGFDSMLWQKRLSTAIRLPLVVLEKGKIYSPPGIRMPEHSARSLVAVKTAQTGSHRALWWICEELSRHTAHAFMMWCSTEHRFGFFVFQRATHLEKASEKNGKKVLSCLTVLCK